MKHNNYPYTVNVDLMIVITAHILRRLESISPQALKREVTLFSVMKNDAYERLPTEVQRFIHEHNIYNDAHKLLKKYVNDKLELCEEKKHLK